MKARLEEGECICWKLFRKCLSVGGVRGVAAALQGLGSDSKH